MKAATTPETERWMTSRGELLIDHRDMAASHWITTAEHGLAILHHGSPVDAVVIEDEQPATFASIKSTADKIEPLAEGGRGTRMVLAHLIAPWTAEQSTILLISRKLIYNR